MRTRNILLLCIVGAALISSVLCNSAIGPDDCCFRYYPRTFPKNRVASYYVTNDRCPKSGVILVTKKTSRHLCADPSLSWVEAIMKSLDENL